MARILGFCSTFDGFSIKNQKKTIRKIITIKKREKKKLHLPAMYGIQQHRSNSARESIAAELQRI